MSSFILLLSSNDVLVEIVASIKSRNSLDESNWRWYCDCNMLSPSPLKEPSGESCCQMAAVLRENFQFAKLKQEGHATHRILLGIQRSLLSITIHIEPNIHWELLELRDSSRRRLPQFVKLVINRRRQIHEVVREYNERNCKLPSTTAPNNFIMLVGIQEQYFLESWHILSILRQVRWLSLLIWEYCIKCKNQQKYTRKTCDQLFNLKLVYATGPALIETFECLNVLL